MKVFMVVIACMRFIPLNARPSIVYTDQVGAGANCESSVCGGERHVPVELVTLTDWRNVNVIRDPRLCGEGSTQTAIVVLS